MNNPELTVSTALFNELDTIASDTGIDPVALTRWKQMIQHNELLLVVVRKGNANIGRLNIWLAKPDEPEIDKCFSGIPLINALQVNPANHRMGAGTMLMDYAHKLLKDRGYASVGLGVEPDNDRAINLYKKCGYAQTKIDGNNTYTTSWDETKPDKTIQRYSVEALFFLKSL
jgi:ribosomal protein S18 acetylase RimI-like enzyme